LGGWLGDETQQTARSDRPPPPARGALPQAHSSPPSAKAAGAAAVSEAPLRETGRLLLSQSEAALARTRLHQIVSLPDEAAGNRMVRGAPAGDLSLELPLALGGETAMAQFRIAADREGGGGSEPGGWQMEFSLAFRTTGEVGARVALRTRRVGVRLWAERAAVAQRLEAALPELREALEAIGLKPGALQVRQGAPRQPARLPGAFMDEVS
ncbi:MAG: flagellar hook-length control protein FliK, partial [Alphaproteobacteria bacterium]